MSEKKQKRDKPVTIKESFVESMQRIVRVEKGQVEKNIKTTKNGKHT